MRQENDSKSGRETRFLERARISAMQGGGADAVAPRLLAWYDRWRRRLPWRAGPGVTADPYRVWLSEIMLQQTTTATVGPYFAAFLERWPDVHALAAAPLDDVLHAWAGLGYYARARNLHKCASVVAREHGGRFPGTENELCALPGIGRYTAAAIAAIAFDRRAVVVDGNVERVMARLFDCDLPLPGAKPMLTALADRCTPEKRPGDYAQAAMDLGATVCTPRRPKCSICPLTDICLGRDRAEALPAKAPKKPRPTRRGVAFWIERPNGDILFRRRAEDGLLGGMMEPPSTEWIEDDFPDASSAPVPLTTSARLQGVVRHSFTHFHLELSVVLGLTRSDVAAPAGCRWVAPDRLGDLALPTVMRKIVAHAMQAERPRTSIEEGAE